MRLDLKMQDIIEKGYEEAREVIRKNIFKNGFYASAGKNGYNAIWARDSMITSLGASLIEDDKFKEAFKQSLLTLAEAQSKRGQIPNAVDTFSERKPHIDFKSIDSTLWFIIGHYIYKERYKDNSLFKRHRGHLKSALIWLSYQDMGEGGMLEQLPTTDWQDAFPHKYGHVLSTQVMYYKVLNLLRAEKKSRKLKKKVNEDKEDGLWGGDFYFSWRWKNHNKYKEIGEGFDSLGNLLAIVFDLADEKKSRKILSYIKSKKINLPYPVKSIYPPIKPGDKEWEEYFRDCEARVPYHYANAGIWPHIGGFYVLALIKIKRFREAENELKKLAEANLNGNFPEWINPLTKKSYGDFQAWNAGMYVLAYKSLKNKTCLI